jgi:hypothetical protein
MTYIRRLTGAIASALLLIGSAQAEPVNCQKQIIKNLLKFKKTYLKALEKCADSENLGKITGPCSAHTPGGDAATQLKIQTTEDKVQAKIALSCPDPDLATLGFSSTCAFEASPTGVEATCAALPVTTPEEFATCLMCWKGAELSGFAASLYASHAVELCGGVLDETSPACSELGCTTPLPDQRDLGDTGENDCQKAVGKGGIKYLVSIEKVLEKCGLLGHDRATCLADLLNQEAIQKAQTKLNTLVADKCGNRDPVPSTPYCCRTGTGQTMACMVSTSRDDCTMNLSGQVMEGKVCNLGTSNCDSLMGAGQKLTWWSTCPTEDTCTGTLTTRDDLVACVENMADQRAQALLCIQFPTGWPCPADE